MRRQACRNILGYKDREIATLSEDETSYHPIDNTFDTGDPHGSRGTQPESINDAGIIVGYYFDANSVYHVSSVCPDV